VEYLGDEMLPLCIALFRLAWDTFSHIEQRPGQRDQASTELVYETSKGVFILYTDYALWRKAKNEF